jgi:hypothetical protein
METSPYDTALHNARDRVKDYPKEEKRQNAESFRQTVMWNNAALAFTLQEELHNDPTISRDSFCEVIKDKDIYS